MGDWCRLFTPVQQTGSKRGVRFFHAVQRNAILSGGLEGGGLLGSRADQSDHGLDSPVKPRRKAPAPEVSSSATSKIPRPPASLLTETTPRPQQSYSVSELAELFGLRESHTESWARRGLLGRPHGHRGHGGNIRFTEKNVVRFIRHHPHEYSLGRVDKIWFKAMVFGRLAEMGKRVS
jgi:hypothetical protein